MDVLTRDLTAGQITVVALQIRLRKNRFVSANMLKSKRVGRKEKLFMLGLIFT